MSKIKGWKTLAANGIMFVVYALQWASVEMLSPSVRFHKEDSDQPQAGCP